MSGGNFSPNCGDLRGPRLGVMVHYSAGSFYSTGEWCRDPRSQVSYNMEIGPKGQTDLIVPWDKRAWHAGVCRTSSPKKLAYRDACSAFYGVSLSGGPPVACTEEQKAKLVEVVVDLFRRNKWPLSDGWRITGHEDEACFPVGHAKEGQRGRKNDPTGPDRAKPWLDLNEIRTRVAKAA